MAQTQLKDFKFPKLERLKLDASADPVNGLINLLRRNPEKGSTSATKPVIDVNRHNLDKTSNDVVQDSIDSESIMQLLTDLELVETVYVGSILDPKSMASAELNYAVDPTVFDSEISRLMLEPIIKFFNKDYRINDKLEKYLSKALFRTGSHVMAILPENVLDNLVNGTHKLSLENFDSIEQSFKGSLNTSYGFLGSSKPNLGLESFAGAAEPILGDKTLKVTDNFNILKKPLLTDRLRELRVNQKLKANALTLGLESVIKTIDFEQIEKLYNNKNTDPENAQIVSSPRYLSRKSVGHPLILDLPSESFIPIFVPGKPEEHLGGFVIIDNNGYPVSKDMTVDFYSEMKSGWNNSASKNADSNSDIIKQAKLAMGADKHNGDFDLKKQQEAYNDILSTQLHMMLANGLYDQDLEIGMTRDIQRIMLQRTWKQKQTQLVFIPRELLIYIAFNYNEKGIGETLLARSKVIATMRSTLLLADTMGGMRNAVGRKRVRITLDPDDPDGEQTISNIQSVLMENAMRSFPLAAPDPTQALDHLMRSGFDFEINTNSADYAETKVEFDDYNTNVNAGNPDLQDRLRRMHISGMGIPPEKVDPMSNPDFATSIVQNDLVLSRRIAAKQKEFCVPLAKMVKVFSSNSSIIRNELNKIVVDNREMLTGSDYSKMDISQIVDEFISSIEVSLPKPDNTQHELQLDQLERYERLLTTALESYITSDLFPEEYLNVPGLVDQAIAQIKAHFIRQFLSTNNILPELNELIEMDDEQPTFNLMDWLDIQQSTLGSVILDFARHVKASKVDLTKKYKDVIESEDDSFGDSDTTDSSDSDDSDAEDDDFDSTSDDGLDDDFDMDGLDDPMGSEAGDQSIDEDSEEPL